MMDIVFASTTQLAAAIRAKRISAIEVLEAHLTQIESHNPALNAIITLDADRARERAWEADAALARGEVWGPLHGVPFTWNKLLGRRRGGCCSVCGGRSVDTQLHYLSFATSVHAKWEICK